MKKYFVILIAIVSFASMQFQCSPKAVDGGITPSVQKKLFIPDFIGKWSFTIPAMTGILPKPMTLKLSIDTNHTFTLKALENMEKTLFSSEGTWKSIPEITFDSIPADAKEVTPDSVILIGQKCMYLDTTAAPDTLAAMKEADCAAPISLGKPKTADEWEIKTKSLAIALGTLPINPQQLALVFQYLTSITLTRDN